MPATASAYKPIVHSANYYLEITFLLLASLPFTDKEARACTFATKLNFQLARLKLRAAQCEAKLTGVQAELPTGKLRLTGKLSLQPSDGEGQATGIGRSNTRSSPGLIYRTPESPSDPKMRLGTGIKKLPAKTHENQALVQPPSTQTQTCDL